MDRHDVGVLEAPEHLDLPFESPDLDPSRGIPLQEDLQGDDLLGNVGTDRHKLRRRPVDSWQWSGLRRPVSV